MRALFSAILPPFLQFSACKFLLPLPPKPPFHLQLTAAALFLAAHTLLDSTSFAKPSPSADRVHSESPLSAAGFCIHLPVQLWQTVAICDHLLICLFGLLGYTWWTLTLLA